MKGNPYIGGTMAKTEVGVSEYVGDAVYVTMLDDDGTLVLTTDCHFQAPPPYRAQNIIFLDDSVLNCLVEVLKQWGKIK
jgi:hypothetical protein